MFDPTENNEPQYTFDDVLIVPKFSDIKSRRDLDFRFFGERNPLDLYLPFISANMDTITGVSMAEEMANLGGCGIMHRGNRAGHLEVIVDAWIKAREDKIFCSTGVIRNTLERDRIDMLVSKPSNRVVICVDIAHGHSSNMLETLKYIRARFSGILIAGNVCTRDGVKFLSDAGVDVVKVGVGGGSVCTTRIETGCGVPQLSAIRDCSIGIVPIIADGGIRTPGDACKALAAGASYVMIGGMLAGTSHAESKNFYRGMASKEAQGGSARYVEGVSVAVKDRGETRDVISRLTSGLASCMSYTGSNNLDELYRGVNFIRVTQSSVKESSPHFGG